MYEFMCEFVHQFKKEFFTNLEDEFMHEIRMFFCMKNCLGGLGYRYEWPMACTVDSSTFKRFSVC